MTIEQFTKKFEAAKPQLKSYILRITASVEDTEDIVQFANDLKNEAETISKTK